MNNVDRGRVIVLFVLYILYTDFFFVTRLIINKINKVQWVDFKLENDLVSLHSLKNGPQPLRGLGSIIFKEWRVTWTFSYTYITYHYYYTLIYHLPLLLHTYISLTITITHLYITYHYYYTLIYHLPLLLHTYISLTITITHLYHFVRTFSVNWSVFSCFGNNVLLVPI